MKPVRFGVVGVAGIIGGTHVRAIRQIPQAQLVAVTDLDLEAARRIAADSGCELLKNFEWMIKRADIDAVCLCTPHALHAPQAIAALKHGKHVLTEKPLALSVDQADKMIEAAAKHDRKLAVVFQYRHRPAVIAAKRLLDAGELGPLYRVTVVHTAFKTQYFYESATWRGTWAGEGGGVLANQAPHFLDLLVHLVGPPTRVMAWNRTLAHSVEVEDCASALVEFPGGAQGYLHFNTFQVPAENRIEIVGDRGALRIEGNEVRLFRPDAPLKQFISGDRSHVYAYPRCREVPVRLEDSEATHAAVLRQFVDAVLRNQPPPCDGAEALKSLELANAMMLSSFTGKPVDLPVGRSAVRRLFRQLAGSSVRGERPKADTREVPA